MKINNKNNSKVVAEAYAAYDAKAKDPAKMITESWAPMIERVTGVKDPEKLAWMSQLAHNTAKLNEDAFQLGSNAPFAAQGGTYTPYNNLYNTIGVGNPVPAGKPALTGADYADNTTLGSGDKYPALLPLALKVAAKTIGFELVNTTPIQGPTGVLPYMDYVYSGSKQPYGATPGYDSQSANPRLFNQDKNFAYSHFGLPASFKASIVPETTTSEGVTTVTKSVSEIKAELKDATKKLILAGTKFETAGEGKLVVEFVGWSRIDGNPMFKVVSGSKSLGDYFDGAAVAGAGYNKAGELTLTGKAVKLANSNADNIATITLAGPQLISMLEDQIQGFAGAGERDRDAWYGTYQDGTVLYEPMSRGTGEMTMPRQLSLQLFTKHIQVGTIQVGCAVTQEQVTDLQKQWGIDVVKMVENAGINELSSTINRHITSRLFALGWKNHCKLVEVEGNNANLNITFDTSVDYSAAHTKMTPALAIPQGETTEGVGYESYTNVALPYKPLYIAANASFENRDTLLKRIATNIMLASNWIQQRGRYGAATFVVTNITVASALQSNAHYTFSPIDNTINQSVGNLYPIGTLAGLTIYVDPLMGGNDTRVLVGRKGGKDEPGVHFCPYVMAESVKIIAEGTAAPKLYIKSRYALVDAGFFPETQYITFCVDMAGI